MLIIYWCTYIQKYILYWYSMYIKNNYITFYLINIHCPESRFYVPAHRGGFRACCGWILSNGNKPCLLIILLSVFLIIDVLHSMYIMIICITYPWMVQASMVIRYSEKHHVISDISIILIWTRISNQFSTCVNYLAHLSHDISRIIPYWIYFLKNISCWVVFKAIWQMIPTMLCFGWIMSEHRHVSGGTRVCFGWNTSKSPKRGFRNWFDWRSGIL